MSLTKVQQLRQARAALGWKQAKVAEVAGVSLPTVKRLETGDGELGVRLETLRLLQTAFEEAGIQFLKNGDSSDGPGVALVRSKPE